jgi:hypothetical protein
MGFQRAGSFALAVTILFFGLYSFLAEEVTKELKGLSEKVERFGGLSGVRKEAISRQDTDALERLDKLQSMLGRSKTVEKAIRRLNVIDLLLGFFGTVQWGYGDVMVCWLDGTNGACS